MVLKKRRKLYYRNNNHSSKNTRAIFCSGVFFVLHFFIGTSCLRALNQSPGDSVWYSFSVDESLTDEQCGVALAQYAAALPVEDRATWGSELLKNGVDGHALLKALQWSNLSAHDLRARLYYFKDMDARSLSLLSSFVSKHRFAWQQIQKVQRETNTILCLALPTPNHFDIQVSGATDLRKVEAHQIKFLGGDMVNAKGKLIRKGSEARRQTVIVEGDQATLTIFWKSKSAMLLQWPDRLKIAPMVLLFDIAEKNIVEGNRTFLTWVVIGADQVLLNEGIGQKQSKGQVFIAPETSRTYSIKAKNIFGECSASTDVHVERVYLGGAELLLSFKGAIGNKSGEWQVRLLDSEGNSVAMKSGVYSSSETVTQLIFPMEVERGVLQKSLRSGKLEITVNFTSGNVEVLPSLKLSYSNLAEEHINGFTWQSCPANNPITFDF